MMPLRLSLHKVSPKGDVQAVTCPCNGVVRCSALDVHVSDGSIRRGSTSLYRSMETSLCTRSFFHPCFCYVIVKCTSDAVVGGWKLSENEEIFSLGIDGFIHVLVFE